MKKFMYLALSLTLMVSLSACGADKAADAAKEAEDKAKEVAAEAEKQAKEAVEEAEKAAKEAVEGEKDADADKKDDADKDADADKKDDAETVDTESIAAPGEAGFTETPIGEEQAIEPFNIAAVYFQPVDMYPADKNPSKEESDMHLEADIHFIPEFAVAYGFGEGDNIWPAYLTVKYDVIDADGNSVTNGSFMPMNADDGPHYGANIKKGLINVGKYTLKITIEPPTEYLLHVDEVTGVGAKQGAKEYFKTIEAEFEWNYTGEQLQNQ